MIILHALTLVAVVLYSHGGLCVLWLLCWLGSAGWAWYGYTHLKVRAIVIDAQGQAWLRRQGQRRLIKAELHHHSLARASLLSLRWQTEHGTISQLLLSDMVDKPAWRCLQVWVRWCQPTPRSAGQLMGK
ncbi:hypothetical protein PT286_06110 [Neisseriaceae bacterium ESL0693]|nr:hypothetical protein [Neisseriaceae bacterium ESL0693]